jgi:hypothetical protein
MPNAPRTNDRREPLAILGSGLGSEAAGVLGLEAAGVLGLELEAALDSELGSRRELPRVAIALLALSQQIV